MHATIDEYNKHLSASDKAICDLMRDEILRALPEAESKIWHGHPVWFLDGNPIVGYHKLKHDVRVLFWSGQSFDEPGLRPEGSFKAADARYADVDQVNTKDLQRWLKKSKQIQWDYKNIVKRKGLLERLQLKDGDQCTVVAGTHAGKSGTVKDFKTSKTGHVTVTVRQANGERFKTLARNIQLV